MKMTESNCLCDLWEHTIAKVFKHDSKSKLGLMFKQWIVFNKLENFNSILNYPIDDLTPSGNLCYMNEHGDILPYTPMKKIFNLRWYIQHLMDESEGETQNPLSKENWMKQNNYKFIKYVIHHRHPMPPEQLKQKRVEEIFKNQHEKVDTDEGESIEEEEKSTTSSDKLKQDSQSDITTEDEEETNTTETHQVHNVLNETIHDEKNLSKTKDNSIHDEYDTSEDESTIEIETFEHYGDKVHETEKSIPMETSQVLTVVNKAIHHEDDSSDDKSVIEIEPPTRENGEQEIGKQDKLLTTKFQIEIENRKVEGLITYSREQQIFKFKVNFWGVNIEFTLYELKWTIDAILQHMGFYHTTENPCVKMRVNHKIKSCEYII